MKYICYRYSSRIEWTVASVEEAVEHAWGDLETGEAAYDSVIDDNGNVLLDRAALHAAVVQFDQRYAGIDGNAEQLGKDFSR